MSITGEMKVFSYGNQLNLYETEQDLKSVIQIKQR